MATTTLKGRIGDFVARKPDGWCAVDIDEPGGFTVRASGVFPLDASLGDTVELVGYYTDTKWGRQFKATYLILWLPGDNRVIEGWLARNLPDIGPVRAADLVKRFGELLWETIEKNPQQLTEVPGITKERAAQIAKVYAQVKSQRDLVLGLAALGIDHRVAAQLASELGSTAQEQLQAEPYELLLSKRVPFEQVDHVAQKRFGVKVDDPRRVRAFVRRELMDRTYRDGHCYTMLFELTAAAAKVLKIKGDVVERALANYGSVVLHGKRAMLLEIDEAERMVASRVRELLVR